jgi:hypothetical protein
MAQKKKQDFTIILIALTALGGYGYWIFDKRKKEREILRAKAAEEAEQQQKRNQTTTTTSAPVPTAAEKAFIDAIHKLQGSLGISPTTGYVGDKTKAALKALNLSDVVTAGNIADLIKKVEAAKKAQPVPAKTLLAADILAFSKKNPGAKFLFVTAYTTKKKILDPLDGNYKDDPNSGEYKIRKGETWVSSKYKPVAITTNNKVIFQDAAKKYWAIPAGNFVLQS